MDIEEFAARMHLLSWWQYVEDSTEHRWDRYDRTAIGDIIVRLYPRRIPTAHTIVATISFQSEDGLSSRKDKDYTCLDDAWAAIMQHLQDFPDET